MIVSRRTMRLNGAEHNPEIVMYDLVLAQQTADRLRDAQIDFCLFSGFHATLLGGHRQTPDIDIWADHLKWDELVASFSEGDIVDRRVNKALDDPYDGVLITLGGGSVAVMSGTTIHSDGITYPSPFTDLVRSNRVYTSLGGIETWFANPADTLLFKAISQRGRDKGKHDLDDIVAINNATRIDTQYLLARISECKAEARTIPLLLYMGVLTQTDLA